MAYRDACVSHTKNGIYGEIFRVPVVDTTAAGDTFLGFFFAMLERFGAERALKIASAASAVAVSRRRVRVDTDARRSKEISRRARREPDVKL